MRVKERPRRPSRITIPPHAHPLVRFVFSEMQRQGVTYVAMADKSGISRETITAWRVRNVPDLTSLEAALGVLGWRIADMLERLPETAPISAEPEIVKKRVADGLKAAPPSREGVFQRLQTAFDLFVGAKPSPMSSLLSKGPQ